MTPDDLAATPEQAIWARLQRHVYSESSREERTVDDKSPWADTLPYLRRHAAEHARRAGELDELLKDPEFLVHAEAGPLGDVLARKPGETAAPGPQATYLASYLAHRASRPEERRQILLIDAARLGQNELAESLHHDGARAVRWATGSGRSAALRHCLAPPGVSSTPGAVAVRASGVVDGRPVVVTTYQSTPDGPEAAVWDLESGHLMTALRRVSPSAVPTSRTAAGRSEPTCAAITRVADGLLVAVGFEDGTVHAWDGLTGLSHSGYGFSAHPPGNGRVAGVTALAFLPGAHGPRLVTGGRDGALRVWDALRPREAGLLDGHDEAHVGGVSVIAAASAPPYGPRDGHDDSSWQVITGGVDGLIRSWGLSAGDSVNPMRKVRGPVSVVSLTLAGSAGEGRMLCLAGREDGSLTLLDPSTGYEQSRIPTDGQGFSDVAVLYGRPHAVCANRDGVVTLWDLQSGRALRHFAGHGEGRTTVTVVELAGRAHVVSGCVDGAVRVWDLEEPMDEQTPIPQTGPSQVRAIALSPGGGLAAAASANDVVVRHLADGSWSEARVPLPAVAACARLSLGWLEGQGPLVALTTDESLTVYGPLTADRPDTVEADHADIALPSRRYQLSGLNAVSVNGHGGLALVATSRPGHPLEIRSHPDGRLLWAAPDHLLCADDPLRSLALGSPTQHLVAGITQRGVVTLWDYGRGWAVRFREDLPGATSLALSHTHTGGVRTDSALCLAVGQDNGAVELWSLRQPFEERPRDERFHASRPAPEDDERLEVVRCPDPVRALAVAPDGTIVVAQGCDLVALDPW